MKRFLILSALFLVPAFMSAKSLEIKVLNQDSDPIPNAYLEINGAIMAATNSEGIGYLNESLLRIGDTISASCIGCVTSEILYDQQLQRKNSCTLVLKGDVYLIDEVVIMLNAYRFFRKSTNICGPVMNDCRLTAALNFTREGPGERSVDIDGQVRLSNRNITGKPRYWEKWYTLAYDFTPENDTTGLSKTIQYHVMPGISILNLALYLTLVEGKDVDYTYLGTRGNDKLFLLTYSQFRMGNYYNLFSYQLLLTVDGNNKNIKSVEMISCDISPHDTGYNHINEMHTYADIEYYKGNVSRKPFLMTRNLEITYHYRRGATSKVVFSDEKITGLKQ